MTKNCKYLTFTEYLQGASFDFFYFDYIVVKTVKFLPDNIVLLNK